jgi:P27 family predicted phage terminase small subunit
MGTRGPAPKPEWLKVLEGNPGKRPLKKPAKAKPEMRVFASPDWLGEAARGHWNNVAPELQRIGLLTELDLTLFAAFCQTYANWVRVEKQLNETGLVYVTPSGQVRPRPELAIAREYMDAILEFSKDFGMTPASRANMSLPTQPDSDSDFERWRMLDA